MSDKGSVNSRLDQSVNGSPKINPDEQRKYLGTYRERVDLAIKISDLNNQNIIKNFQNEIRENPNYQILLNGRIDHDLVAPYMKIATQQNIKFSIKNDSFYNNSKESYGLIYAADHAINKAPIDINKKYPNNETNENNTNNKNKNKNNASKGTLWDKIKHIF